MDTSGHSFLQQPNVLEKGGLHGDTSFHGSGGELPRAIGPHEGRECDLMLSGAKPFSMFCDVDACRCYFPDAEFSPHIESGRIFRKDMRYRGVGQQRPTIAALYLWLPGEEWRMMVAHRIHAEIFSGARMASDEDDLIMGRLLGYSEADIATYLAHARHHRRISRDR